MFPGTPLSLSADRPPLSPSSGFARGGNASPPGRRPSSPGSHGGPLSPHTRSLRESDRRAALFGRRSSGASPGGSSLDVLRSGAARANLSNGGSSVEPPSPGPASAPVDRGRDRDPPPSPMAVGRFSSGGINRLHSDLTRICSVRVPVLALGALHPSIRGPSSPRSGAPPPPPSCTDWTRLVLLPVLTGLVSSFSPYGLMRAGAVGRKQREQGKRGVVERSSGRILRGEGDGRRVHPDDGRKHAECGGARARGRAGRGRGAQLWLGRRGGAWGGGRWARLASPLVRAAPAAGTTAGTPRRLRREL